MLPVHVFDYVIDQVGRDIGRVRPEQGGALLGLRGRDVLTAFVHDARAQVTRVEYSNTAWLLSEIGRLEEAGPVRFKGIVHSHPTGMPRPSRQDHREYGRTLEAVPDLGRYLAPIVTHDLTTPGERHELFTDSARISFFGAMWAERGVRLEPMRPVVVPLAAAFRQAGLSWSDSYPVTTETGGVPGVRVPLPRGRSGARRYLFATADFPLAPPLLLEEAGADGPHPELIVRELGWDPRIPETDRLREALGALEPPGSRAAGPAPSRRTPHPAPPPGPSAPVPAQIPVPAPTAASVPTAASAPTPVRPAREAHTRDQGTPQPLAHPQPPLLGPPKEPLLPSARPPGRIRRLGYRAGIGRNRGVREGLFARTQGLLSPALADTHVLLVGVGSVGSHLAELLVRSGVGRLTLVDPDRVEPANLGRSLFGVRDIGRNKARATARRLRRINKRLKVTVLARDVASLDDHHWHQRISDAQLVVAATDDNQAQQRLNHLSYFLRRPALFIGLYDGAAGGEVVFTTPGSPCWSCATGGVRESLGELGHQPRTDYGTGRLYAVPGLLTDIQHLTAAAAKIALALLHQGGGPERIGGFLTAPLRKDLSMALFAMEPDHWFFPRVLGEAPGQHAFQSIWLRTGRRPDCPVCGDPSLRSDPRDHVRAGDSAELTRRQRRAFEERHGR
ncbi:ThiF family adenylyltransferase [Streptomyces sp. G-G2]|uniref:ThiF family adenylyltransferase n=1 Tax=Streptomyces sp. G-G2 TaxID=3046201 RepID=UPI0024B8F382|nr:ThiF family adenylyltransferase [Streptomyces sp. G-G2]MDJ0385857.1 ThiF family adenylyltransferase [Streptomyces sp. G-G2]